MNTCITDKNRWRDEFCVHRIACYGLRGTVKDMLVRQLFIH